MTILHDKTTVHTSNDHNNFGSVYIVEQHDLVKSSPWSVHELNKIM